MAEVLKLPGKHRLADLAQDAVLALFIAAYTLLGLVVAHLIHGAVSRLLS